MKKPYVTTIKIILPWWLKWSKNFIKLNIERHELSGLKGQSVNALIIDDVEDYK